jgi:hypothetical protein
MSMASPDSVVCPDSRDSRIVGKSFIPVYGRSYISWQNRLLRGHLTMVMPRYRAAENYVNQSILDKVTIGGSPEITASFQHSHP